MAEGENLGSNLLPLVSVRRLKWLPAKARIGLIHLRMLRYCERVVLVRGGWIDDGGAAMAVAGGNEGRGEIVAQQRDVDGVAPVGDRKRAGGAGAAIAGLPLQGGKA